MAPPPPGTLRLAAVLLRFRWRAMTSAVWHSPRGKSMRIVWLFALLTPVAYTALMVQALDTIAALAGPAVQIAALAAVCGAIVLASFFGKMASNDAVVAGAGENEFFLGRPFGLARLVVARSLAGAATDIFDALFLAPALIAGALVWHQGVPGVALAFFTSVVVQVGVTATAQAAQVLVVRLVGPTRLRIVWPTLTLLAALTMACLWMIATWVLRRPTAAVAYLEPRVDVFRFTPGAAIVAPLQALASRGPGAAASALGLLSGATALVLRFVAWIVSWATADGWEQASVPWASAGRRAGPRRRKRPMGPFSKDWALMVRDPSRLLRLVAMPLVFVGVQLFGSAGWSWSTANPRNVAVVSFSLAAYAATFGPLSHMEAERRAFWILRSVPVPLGRLMAGKAAFWSLVIGAMGTVTFVSLTAASAAPVSTQTVTLGLLVLTGSVLVSWLGVALACGAADLSDEARSALAPVTAYLFMLLSGLYNTVLTEASTARWQGLILYAMTVALYWVSGVGRAALAFDPEAFSPAVGAGGKMIRVRPLFPGHGAAFAIFLFLGNRLTLNVAHVAGLDASAVEIQAAIWVVVGAAALIYLLSRTRGPRDLSRQQSWGLVAALGLGLFAGTAVATILEAGRLFPADLLSRMEILRAPVGVLSPVSLLLGLLVEELVFRGVVQSSMEGSGSGRVLAFAVSLSLSVASGSSGFSAVALLTHLAAASGRAVSGRLSSGVAARLMIAAALVFRGPYL